MVSGVEQESVLVKPDRSLHQSTYYYPFGRYVPPLDFFDNFWQKKNVPMDKPRTNIFKIPSFSNLPQTDSRATCIHQTAIIEVENFTLFCLMKRANKIELLSQLFKKTYCTKDDNKSPKFFFHGLA